MSVVPQVTLRMGWWDGRWVGVVLVSVLIFAWGWYSKSLQQRSAAKKLANTAAMVGRG